MIKNTEQEIVDRAITSRHSMRAFLPTAVAREDIELMLEVAARAPSGSNTQPWRAYVLTGTIKQRLSSEILATLADPAKADEITEEYRYYPHNWVSPYIDRRRKVGLVSTICSVLAAMIRLGCRHSMSAISFSLMRRWGLFSRSSER